MKVNPANVKASQIATTAKNEVDAAKSSAAKNKSAVNAGDIAASSKVNVSERAQMMQKAKEIASKDSVNEARVAELQRLIDSGKYNTSASAIADRMVDEHLLMSE